MYRCILQIKYTNLMVHVEAENILKYIGAYCRCHLGAPPPP